MGAVKGKPQALKLEPKKEMIYECLSKGLSKTAIAKLLDSNQGTLDRFLKRYPLEVS